MFIFAQIFKNVMARRRSNKKEEETLVDIVEARDNAKDYFGKNQKMILGIALAVALLVGAFVVYKFLIKEPQEKQAMEAMYWAEYQFARDSFAIALENPGRDMEGFLDIIDNYGGTSAANLSKYYAGVSYLNLGKYDAAVDYLESFSPKGTVTPIMKFGALGDAYSELNEFDKALSSYKKASGSGSNDLLTPYYLQKYGMLQERQGNSAEALSAYNQIKEKYPLSTEGTLVDKYISRVQ